MSSGSQNPGSFLLCLAGALTLGMLVTSCASSPHRSDTSSRDSGRVVRPELGVEYDVLVGEMAVRGGEFEVARGAFEQALTKDPDSAHLHFRLAQLVAQSDELPEATVLAERGMELDSENVEGRLFLARIYRMQRDLPGVKRALLDAESQPISPQAALALYQVYLEMDELQLALELAQSLFEDDPTNLGAAMAVATTYERMGRFQDAEEALLLALDQHPNRFVVYARLARMRRARGDRDGEIALYRDVLQEYPDHYGTLISLGEAQIAQSDFDGAIETHIQILELFPDDLEVLRRLASLEFGVGRYEAAADRLRHASTRYPQYSEFAYSLGQVLRAMAEREEAIDAFDQVNKSHPLYVESRLQVAILLQETGRLEEALEEIEELRALRPDRGLDFHAAALRAQTGDLQGGVLLLEEMLEETPDDEEVLYQLGVLYGTQQNEDKALEYMQRVLKQNPENAQALNYVGYTWAERGERLDQAEEMIRQAVRLSPRDGYIADSLGWVYYMQAQPLLQGKRRAEGLALLEKALEQLDLAVELTGGDPVVSEHLGDVYLSMDRPQLALEYYEQAVELEPREVEQPNLFQKLDRVRQAIGSRQGPTPEPDSQ